MKTKQKIAVPILADREVFDYLKEKVGERKTKTEAFCDLLDKSLAGFVSPFLRNKGYELQPNQCHVTVSDLSSEWHILERSRTSLISLSNSWLLWFIKEMYCSLSCSFST